MILDNAPARSAELLSQDRVDAALVPVIAYQQIDGVRVIRDVCVGARERLRSVCLVTNGQGLKNVNSVALDTSSLTSVVLTKIIFREFLGFEPEWISAQPIIDTMLVKADCALLIGDPALGLSIRGAKATEVPFRIFDLAELWHTHTGLGFVFAMWMTRRENTSIDFAAARDEGLAHIDEIISNYDHHIHLGADEMKKYLLQNISYSVDDSMHRGMELYFELAAKNGLISRNLPIEFA